MATRSKKRFGQLIREKRQAKGLSLRKFAGKVGMSPTYLSQIEQGNCDPPTAERVQRMAEILNENADELTSLAGRVPDDVQKVLEKQPASLTALLREASDLTPSQLEALAETARQLKGPRRK